MTHSKKKKAQSCGSAAGSSRCRGINSVAVKPIASPPARGPGEGTEAAPGAAYAQLKSQRAPPSPNKRLHLLLLWRERSPSCELGEAGGDAGGPGGGDRDGGCNAKVRGEASGEVLTPADAALHQRRPRHGLPAGLIRAEKGAGGRASRGSAEAMRGGKAAESLGKGWRGIT